MIWLKTNQLKLCVGTSVLLAAALLGGACSGAKEKAESTASNTASAVTSAVKNAVTGGGNFEGVIAMQMKGREDKVMNMTYYVKGERARVEMQTGEPMGSGVMLWDMPNGKMTMLIPAQKMYITMDVKRMGEDIKAARGKDDETHDVKFPKLTATGKTETIAGHTCEHYLMGDKQEVDMCVAKGLGYFGMGNQAGGMGMLKNLVFSPKLLAEAAAHPEWVKFLEGGAFPLKLTVTENGKPGMTMEATKIEQKKLDDSLFTVPPDYREQKMPQIPAR